ncbi:MAG: hypothetical protein CVU87_03580 [Firmicutes bacterium HGW-Firmicutes-12]|nr:MAG: hypothetical protein CVU87_03580 [Firmicutes bacterium HGW-Firmicutes-12]
MVIYTPIPPEIIWQDTNETDFKIIEEKINGIAVNILVTSDSTARIERILSTDPQDYLKALYQPGLNIEYQAVMKK